MTSARSLRSCLPVDHPFHGLKSKHYGAILADPPWSFRGYSKDGILPQRFGLQHYSTLSLQNLKALPVMDLAAKNCALFLWIVDTHVEMGIELAKTWGFKFKTVAFVWDKDKIGMGFWTRKQCEICYMFTVGKPSRLSAAVRQKITAPRQEHSRKPAETHNRIEALVQGPYCELFARETFPGWSSWGNEINKF